MQGRKITTTLDASIDHRGDDPIPTLPNFSLRPITDQTEVVAEQAGPVPRADVLAMVADSALL